MQIVFLFYEGMTALDAIGPHEVLCRLPGVVVRRVALMAGPIRTDSAELVIHADYPLSAVSRADVLVIPGSGHATTLRQYPEILSWVRAIHLTTKWTTSVCTGSLVLGAAGLLSGLKATSHWTVLDRLSHWGAIPTEKRIVEDGKVITAAGVSAGIDMALALAAKIAGKQVAEAIQLGIEYDPEPPFNAGSTKKASPSLVQALRKRFIANF
jgi:transcriptional regulator GlxA family with amidase domain